jgi:uncharacterized protein YgiM (DUF1202 family)
MMFGPSIISRRYAALIVVSVILCGAGSFEAQAGGGRPHQNLGIGMPQQCATLQSGTPGYKDCMANYASAKTATINTDTQLKAEPNSSSKAVGILNKGTQVALIERTANGFWCHVNSGGFDGYVPFELMDFESHT